MKGLVLDANSMGGKALQAFTDGNTDISKEMADQLNSFVNRLLGVDKKKKGGGGEYDTSDENDGFGPMAFNGTPGFQDFGSGTRATLHGSEMVLPERNVGELAKQLALAVGSMTTTNNNTNANAGDVITTNTQAIDMTTLNTNTSELIDLNKKLAQHLNTLVTIGAMTEKNTKNFNNNLANMSGSLV